MRRKNSIGSFAVVIVTGTISSCLTAATGDDCVIKTVLSPVVAGATSYSEVFTQFSVLGSNDVEGVVEFDISAAPKNAEVFLEMQADRVFETPDGSLWTGLVFPYVGDGQVTSIDHLGRPGNIPLGQVCGYADISHPKPIRVTEAFNSANGHGAHYLGFLVTVGFGQGTPCPQFGSGWRAYDAQDCIGCTPFDNFRLVFKESFDPGTCCSTLVIEQSEPSNGTIDAREDVNPDGIPEGFNRFRLTFSCPVHDALTNCSVSPDSFVFQDATENPPQIVSLYTLAVAECGEHSGPIRFDVLLDRPITPGVWTTLVANFESSSGIEAISDIYRVGFLPGDANGSGTSNPVDILALIDNLNHVTELPLPIERSDIDRSGAPSPADILRMIDLLNGVNTTRPWNGAALPQAPK